MASATRPKPYDLEDRTLEFSRRVRYFISRLEKTLGNIEDAKQLLRSSGSVGANHIEAKESVSKKDFSLRFKICRKEAEESRYWMSLIDTRNNQILDKERNSLAQEATRINANIRSHPPDTKQANVIL